LNKETHKIFDSHKNLNTHPARITLTNLKSHQANQPEAQEYPNLVVVVPSQPYICSSSYLQVKLPPKSTKIFKPWVAIVYCKEKEFSKEEWQSFVLKNSYSHFCSRKHSLYSLV